MSRSGKEILHLDANPYYGGAQAALSLQEADDWVANHQSPQSPDAFSAAQVLSRSDSLSFSRAYSLDLAPQIIYARSTLLPQLVSSKAFRQLEFLAVGSFYIYSPSSAAQARPTLNRIPSTREDVFITTSIPPRSKRFLMKFIKFALDYQAEPQAEIWKPNANQPLVTFLESHFNLDSDLQAYLIALTLSLDGKISVEAGLASIHRHLTSIGVFGPGFAAVYPKWGGLSEVAQVGCRAAAVGGATYMLATSVSHYRPSTRSPQDAKSALEVTLSNGLVLQAGALVKNADRPPDAPTSISRLMAIVNSDLTSLFESASEAAPTPCLAIVSFPPRSITLRDATTTTNDVPLYALVLSSLSGQCPAGQCESKSLHPLPIAVSLFPKLASCKDDQLETNTYLHCLNLCDDSIF